MATQKKTKNTRSRTVSRTPRKATRTPEKTAPRRASAPAARGQSGALSLRSAAPSFTVDDIEASLAFYRDVLGFVVQKRWEEGGKLMGVEVVAGQVTFMLGQDDWKKGRDRVKGQGFRLYCDTDQDIDALAARIKEKGGTLAQEPRDEEWEEGKAMRALTIDDPDGFKLTIAARKKKKG